MNIKVIGCSTCWTDRPTSSYCVNHTTLVDCGEGTFKYYKKANVDFYAIKNIFITHIHGDHTFALYNYLCQHISYNSEEQRKSLTVYGPKGLKKLMYQILESFSPEIDYKVMEDYVNVIEISDFSKSIMVDGLKIQPLCLKHGVLQDIAYVIDDGKVKVGFSGDCTMDENVSKFVEMCDVLFLECCSEKTSANHLGYDVYKKIIDANPNKKFYAIHCTDYIYNNADKLGITVAFSGQISDF